MKFPTSWRLPVVSKVIDCVGYGTRRGWGRSSHPVSAITSSESASSTSK